MMKLKQKAVVGMGAWQTELDVSEMAEGCVGCLLVFKTKKDAMKYAGKGIDIVKCSADQKGK